MAEIGGTAKFLGTGGAINQLYVDPLLATSSTGTYSIANRNGSGTDGIAYKSLADAIPALNAGGTILLRSGTHTAITDFGGGSQCCFWINKALTIQNYNGEAATLTYPAGTPPLIGSDYGPIIYATVGSWTLDGVTVSGTRPLGDSPGGGDTDVNIQFGATIGDMTIRRCTITNAGHAGIKFQATSGQVLVERNHFGTTGFTGRDHHVYAHDGNATYPAIFRFNEMTAASGYALHWYDQAVNMQAYGNIIHHCGGNYTPVGGGGILMSGTGHTVINNTIADCTGYGGIVFWKNAAGGNTVKNNIVRNGANVTDDIVLDASFGPNTAGHNNKHTISSDPNGAYAPGGTDLDINPLFTSGSPATWTDYTLQGGSPMIAAGEAQSAPYNQALDPAQTTTPTAKTQANPPTIGGFTT